MLERVVIADASTLIGLANIDSIDLLQQLYEQIAITSIVRNELSLHLPTWIEVNDNYKEVVFRSLVPQLDIGEASAIALALENENSLLIIDERKGRKYAREMGITITGVTGIIIKAKEQGVIISGKQKLDQLMESGFRLSKKIYQLALERMKEA